VVERANGPAEGADAYDTRPIRRVLVLTYAIDLATGRETEALQPVEAAIDQLARNQLRLREGAPFSAAQASEDLTRLNALGRFRTAEVGVAALDDGGVELRYVVRVQPLITAVQTVGNRLIPDADLLKLVDILVGTPVDQTQLDRAARRIESAYRTKGYFGVLVSVDRKQLEESGVVLFAIREGVRTRVSKIQFTGNDSFSNAELRSKIETKTAGLLRDGNLDNELIGDDVAALARFYKDRGFIDVRCSPVVTPSPDAREAIVEFLLEEGPLYTLRDVKVVFGEGEAGVFSPQQLVGLMPLKPGDVYSDLGVQRSLSAIRAAYGRMGYADVQVGKRELRSQEGPHVDLLLIVQEGERVKTGVIEIIGNSTTRDDVIRRLVTLQPDRPLDKTQVDETQRRLEATRLFAPRSAKLAFGAPARAPAEGEGTGVRTAMSPETFEDAEEGYRDIIIEVDETNTASFNIGAQAGSDGGITGVLSLQQRNFDITDTPDSWDEFISNESFRGGGQTFSITLQPGDRVRNFSISLSDPALGATDISGSASVYFNQRIYSAYDEQRVGGRFAIGRRFGSLWNVSVPLRIETIDLSDLDPDAPTEYFEVSDQRLIDSLGITLSRQSFDRAIFPTKGYRVELGVEQYGLLGDDTFTKISGEASRYLKLEEDVLGRSTTLFLRARAAFIPGDEGVAPFYERAFLGGQGFRGFAFRGASPVGIRNDNGQVGDDPVGGNWMFFAGAELTRPLIENLVAGVVFVDTGTVERDLGFDDYRVSVGFGVRITVEALSNQPLAFDFGFPIVKEDTDRERLFTFSLDIPFN
jgi:outer membrane protein insertion porin family